MCVRKWKKKRYDKCVFMMLVFHLFFCNCHKSIFIHIVSLVYLSRSLHFFLSWTMHKLKKILYFGSSDYVDGDKISRHLFCSSPWKKFALINSSLMEMKIRCFSFTQKCVLVFLVVHIQTHTHTLDTSLLEKYFLFAKINICATEKINKWMRSMKLSIFIIIIAIFTFLTVPPFVFLSFVHALRENLWLYIIHYYNNMRKHEC